MEKKADDLTECFRHHILTTIGWMAFGSRPGPEMQMYEEGFKAGYQRCKSDNELELGEVEQIEGELKLLQERFSRVLVSASEVREAVEWCLKRDERNGSLPGSYAEKLRSALSKATS